MLTVFLYNREQIVNTILSKIYLVFKKSERYNI